MTRRAILPLALLLMAALLLPAAASGASRYRVGIGDQDIRIFGQPLFQALELKRIRFIVPWNWNEHEYQEDEVRAFVTTARQHGFEPFVAFTAARGCWTGTRYKRTRACRAPSGRAYARKLRQFRSAFPEVEVFSPWNEANHKSQPTYRSPKRAARYYNIMRRHCRGCRIVALDLLDSSNMARYARAFRRHAKGSPRIWGLHNYSDVNRKRARKTKQLLRIVPGQVWLTETGGIVSFTSRWPYNLQRAKSRTAYMFRLADRLSRKRRGHRSRITRLYPYQYTGVERGTRFDAGLVNPDGSARPAYHLFKRKLRTRSR